MNPTHAEAVVGEIRAEMGRAGVSSRTLAERLGVSHMWLSRRLRGPVELSLGDVERIANALGVDRQDIYDAAARRSGEVPA